MGCTYHFCEAYFSGLGQNWRYTIFARPSYKRTRMVMFGEMKFWKQFIGDTIILRTFIISAMFFLELKMIGGMYTTIYFAGLRPTIYEYVEFPVSCCADDGLIWLQKCWTKHRYAI
jgi:hypothetical protein